MKRLRFLLCAQVAILVGATLTSESALGQVLGESLEPREEKIEVEGPLPEVEPQKLSTPRLNTPKLEIPPVPPPPNKESLPPPQVESSSGLIRSDDLVELPSQSPLTEVFEGDFAATLPEDFSQGQIPIYVRQYRMTTNHAGQSQRVVEMSQQAVDPRSPNLTAEQKLGVFVYINESAIREKQTALFQVEDAKANDKLLHELRALYTKRFEIDTAYQDFKVREIERRAKKLRAEVNAREKAADNWVEAMVTLAKMRADGIETMDSLATPAVSNQRGAFGTGVLSGSVNAVPSRDNFQSNSFGQPNTRMTNSVFPAASARANRNPSSLDARPSYAPLTEPHRN